MYEGLDGEYPLPLSGELNGEVFSPVGDRGEYDVDSQELPGLLGMNGPGLWLPRGDHAGLNPLASACANGENEALGVLGVIAPHDAYAGVCAWLHGVIDGDMLEI